MRIWLKRWVVLMVLVAFISCEKNIDFNLAETAPVLVVDASIENGQPPMVILTKSFSYFDKISPAILANAFVHNAVVTMSNGTVTHRLKEYAYPLAPGYTGFYYSLDSANLSTAIVGEFNRQYDLNIQSDGQTYTSTIGIPALAVRPDSVWFKPAPQNPDTNKRVLFIKATDPRGLGNYIRYFTKNNSGPFLPGENSVYDDQVLDGSTYEVQLPQGIDRNAGTKADSLFFKKGDTVTLKFCNIERPAYKFWSTWEFAYQGIGNPFSQPNKVLGNISNNALGAFCGYAAYYKTVIVR
ncbi:MAG: hypothetical protein JWQ27_486 [Ferruginibacter sp.]|nr:hypothetical protein [Ferruginibacter sp.]